MTLASHKLTPACLSHLRLARLASEDERHTPQDDEHLAHCDVCAAILQEHRELVSAAMLERIPAVLSAEVREPPKSLFGTRFIWQAVAFASVLAAVVQIARVADQPRITNVKGAVALAVSIQHNATLVVDELPIEKVDGVQSGDQVRLRLVGVGNQFVRLDVCTAPDACESMYAGKAPSDGWVPTAFNIDGSREVIVKLRVGPDADAAEHSEPQAYTLRAR